MMREVQINKNTKLREDGKLFNIRTGKEFIPKARNGHGYLLVQHNGCTRYVHQLVMEYFGEPKPGPEYQIDHKNQNILDNDINNLRWVTPRENSNNRKDNLPAGQRKCDLDPKEYNRQRNAARYKKKKKKEGG